MFHTTAASLHQSLVSCLHQKDGDHFLSLLGLWLSCIQRVLSGLWISLGLSQLSFCLLVPSLTDVLLTHTFGGLLENSILHFLNNDYNSAQNFFTVSSVALVTPYTLLSFIQYQVDTEGSWDLSSAEAL